MRSKKKKETENEREKTVDNEAAVEEVKPKKKKKKGGGLTTGLLLIFFLAGLSLLLYPTISNYVNSKHSTQAISAYSKAVDSINPAEYSKLIAQAEDFNRRAAARYNQGAMTDEEIEEYYSLLDVSGTGAMGYVEVPSIEVSLPVYHGTSNTVLNTATGHLEWSSLPVGGINTHAVISGHRGLPSAKLFTHLDKLVVGDIFMIRVLNEIVTYEVDQVLIVEPKDTHELMIVNGKDYCTLVTCTPYGINTHRLLVRGHRIENAEKASALHIVADAVQIDNLIVACVLGVPLLILLVAFALAGNRNRGKFTG